MSLSPVDNARNLPDSTYGIPNEALRHRIMDYLPSTHNASYGGNSDIAYGWPCEADQITVLHAENLGIADADGKSGIHGLNTLQNLVELYLDGNSGIRPLYPLSTPSPLTKLEILSLKDCSNIINDGIPIRTLTALNTLDLTNCTLIASLNRTLYNPCTKTYLPNLEELDLSGCTGLTTCGIKVLAGLPKLKRVSLAGCAGIASLDCLIVNTSFTGASAYLDFTGVTLTPALKVDIACLRGKGVIVDSNCTDCENICLPEHVIDPEVSTECSTLGDFFDCTTNSCAPDLMGGC